MHIRTLICLHLYNYLMYDLSHANIAVDLVVAFRHITGAPHVSPMSSYFFLVANWSASFVDSLVVVTINIIVLCTVCTGHSTRECAPILS